MNTTYAPLPQYPEALRDSGRQGLVVIELVVGPDGKVREHLIHEAFDPAAARSVVETVKSWRFHSIEEMKRNDAMTDCEDCLRIGRLAFRFEIRNGSARVIDLADEENRRLGHPNVFEKKKRR
ncbi:MAG: TonB family protein [Bryobacteraceae bacterium]